MRNHVAGIPDNEHVSNIGLGEPGGEHPGVDTGHEHGGGDGIVPHLFELLHHVPLLVHPILHYAMQHLIDAHTAFHNHFLSFYSRVTFNTFTGKSNTQLISNYYRSHWFCTFYWENLEWKVETYNVGSLLLLLLLHIRLV